MSISETTIKNPKKIAEFYKQLSEQNDIEINLLKKQNERLLELCMYSLIRDTKIYNHELCDLIKLKFMNIILQNLNDDTYTLRNKLIEAWESDK